MECIFFQYNFSSALKCCAPEVHYDSIHVRSSYLISSTSWTKSNSAVFILLSQVTFSVLDSIISFQIQKYEQFGNLESLLVALLL